MEKIRRPKDANQLAKLIMEMATGQKENDKEIILKEKAETKTKKKKATKK